MNHTALLTCAVAHLFFAPVNFPYHRLITRKAYPYNARTGSTCFQPRGCLKLHWSEIRIHETLEFTWLSQFFAPKFTWTQAQLFTIRSNVPESSGVIYTVYIYIVIRHQPKATFPTFLHPQTFRHSGYQFSKLKVTETDHFVILLSAWFLAQLVNLFQFYGILMHIVTNPKRGLKNQHQHKIHQNPSKSLHRALHDISWHWPATTQENHPLSTRCSSAAALAEMASSLGTTFRTTTHPPATALVRQGRNDWIWPKICACMCGEKKSMCGEKKSTSLVTSDKFLGIAVWRSHTHLTITWQSLDITWPKNPLRWLGRGSSFSDLFCYRCWERTID